LVGVVDVHAPLEGRPFADPRAECPQKANCHPGVGIAKVPDGGLNPEGSCERNSRPELDASGKPGEP
jgi:hypothetical protein